MHLSSKDKSTALLNSGIWANGHENNLMWESPLKSCGQAWDQTRNPGLVNCCSDQCHESVQPY